MERGANIIARPSLTSPEHPKTPVVSSIGVHTGEIGE
ncbi:hypothetical protein LINPERHAP1_LOCUS13692 [Linum perenne]